MEIQVLNDPNINPKNKILENVLGKNYQLYKEFLEKIESMNLVPEWNYYNDGKSWLCKILNKKKNLCWLSVWNVGFKLTFLFTEKTINGVYELETYDEIKRLAKENKTVGKLIPIIITIRNKKTLDYGLKLLEYKMTFPNLSCKCNEDLIRCFEAM